jgi:hypothetical protein
MNSRFFHCLPLLGALLLAADVGAQRKTPDLPPEAKARLDHHVGEWDIRTEYLDRNGKATRTSKGSDSAKYIIDGRVVELTTTSASGVSKAWMFYNVAEQKFYLTSVDARGDHWTMTGGLDEYVITSTPKPRPRGGTMIIRFTHTNIEENSFEALMESSIDGGQSWWQRYRQYATRR